MKKLNMTVNTRDVKSRINREIYGNFSEHLGRCIYNGIYVGEGSEIPNTDGIRNDIIEAFKNIRLPVLRWPGGCFADEYHWKDGIGDKSTRKKMVNTNWGGVTEDNSFGTHEFFRLCELIGCEPYISGNIGSGTVHEMSEWVEYMTFDGVSPMADLRRKNGQDKAWKLKYFGIGNETWGCGGNMRPEFYVDEFRRYASYCKDFGEGGLFKIACGPNADDYNWTNVIMRDIPHNMMKAISLHYYTIPSGDWNTKGHALTFSDEQYYSTIKNTRRIDEIISQHDNVMTRYDKDHKVGLIVDEWGCWYEVEEGTNPGFLYQQNTMRDALVAANNLDIFNKHSDRVIMANIAQAVNVLQAVMLTDGEKMLLTPTYHVFDLYKIHQGAKLVYSHTENDDIDGFDIKAVSQSASISEDGTLNITLSNCSLTEEYEISCELCGFEANSASARILTGEAHDHNDFDNMDKVTIKPCDMKIDGGKLIVKLPPCSVVAAEIKAQ